MRPDAVSALAAYVERQAVSSARIVELIPAAHAMQCSAGDGSRWYVATDRYGETFGWADTLADAVAQVHSATRDPRGPVWTGRASTNSAT